jgi:hypothetical protein
VFYFLEKFEKGGLIFHVKWKLCWADKDRNEIKPTAISDDL